MADLMGPYGVLLFLYSVVLTKVYFSHYSSYWNYCTLQGVHKLLEEREETEQPLIDPVHGHGRYINVVSAWLVAFDGKSDVLCYF